MLTTIFLIQMFTFVVSPLNATENSVISSSSDYIIGDGDVLYVSVWKDETLSRELTVLPGGKITFPLVGDLMVTGKTVAQVQKELESRIVPFVPNPYLTVEVHAVNSLSIYILGQVKDPGRFLLNSRVDVLQALAMAGGINAFAKSGQIKILRTNGTEKQTIRFDYDAVCAGKKMSQNILLERGDVIVVP
jgi:polysaccharide export outer membrane protein